MPVVKTQRAGTGRQAFLSFLAAALVLPGVLLATPDTPTFTEDVAPIFFDHCVSCHRPGEVAPMSLLTYEESRPWARSIARKVRSLEMPPWSGESDKRVFRNDLSLHEEQITTIEKWVAAGAPEGDIEALPEAPVFRDGWTLGEPDLVVTLAEVAVPADGDDLFPQEWIDLELEEEQWVRAIEFMPGDRRVTHHFQSTYNSPGSAGTPIGNTERKGSRGQGGSGVFAIWTAGMPPYVFPEGMGRVLTPGTRILVDSHYHPMGEATVDRTRIGVYFGEGELRKEVATMFGVDTGLRIPPGASHHPEHAFHFFDRDMQILAFSPHMHLRGKAMRYDLIYPDGARETLLDVPKYDYNWQWLYYPTEPIDVPRGSRLDVTAVWDNSADNPANPDPSREIIYRGDVFNEMFVGFFEAIQKDGVYHEPAPPLERLATLMEQHPAEGSWLVKGFLPIAFHLPAEGEGRLYLVQGVTMFTITLDDYTWNGNELTVRTQLPTPEASATTTIIEGQLDDQGRIKGMLRYGIDSAQPLEVPLLAQPIAPGAGSNATGAAAGR